MKPKHKSWGGERGVSERERRHRATDTAAEEERRAERDEQTERKGLSKAGNDLFYVLQKE